ncbi:hypothetical protein [Allohahella marinimesophila]|uniref:PEP-CTERM protein-sorting domain-containing protein n=1 Tax=Allohahella marinimesophila TaxID=1054972 RepID=A0ABP7Q839_9GAMM
MKAVVSPRFALSVLAMTLSTMSVSATVISGYDVSDTASKNCGGVSHGLSTNSLKLGAKNCMARSYSLEEGAVFLQSDDGTARLLGTAVNPYGVSAAFDLLFTGFTDSYSVVKKGGSSNTSDWNFYTGLSADSRINVDGTDYYAQLVAAPGKSGKAPVFQFGTGANDKTNAFGGSVWMDIYAANGQPVYTGSKHWDLNFDLSYNSDLVPDVNVPTPATLGLLVLGVAVLCLSRRKKAQA